jgi:hypothetical protein
MSDHRSILHVDMDAFFAAVEQRDNPALAGHPVVVGGTGGRGVVAAASYEVRRFGVHSAMPMRDALKRCPQAIVVRPRMKRYHEVSEQVFEIFGEFTDLVEGLSLDEAFLDVTGSTGLFGSAEAMAREIKNHIRARTGLTASVGVSHNKLLAKARLRMNKPDGLTVIRPRMSATLDLLRCTGCTASCERSRGSNTGIIRWGNAPGAGVCARSCSSRDTREIGSASGSTTGRSSPMLPRSRSARGNLRRRPEGPRGTAGTASAARGSHRGIACATGT